MIFNTPFSKVHRGCGTAHAHIIAVQRLSRKCVQKKYAQAGSNSHNWTHANVWESMGKPSSCTQFISIASHARICYQVLKVTCTASVKSKVRMTVTTVAQSYAGKNIIRLLPLALLLVLRYFTVKLLICIISKLVLWCLTKSSNFSPFTVPSASWTGPQAAIARRLWSRGVYGYRISKLPHAVVSFILTFRTRIWLDTR